MANVLARTIPIATTTTDLTVIGGASVLFGWTWIETTGSAVANVELYDGSGTNGALIVPVALNSGESTRDLWGHPGLGVQTGLFLHVVSGSVKGSLWIVPGEVYDEYVIEQGYRGVFGHNV